MNPRVEQLKETVELNYHCRAKHIGSAGVVEMRGGERLWQGIVEIFDVSCHLPVNRCYAWRDPMGPAITILGLGPVHSPAAAVRDAMRSTHPFRIQSRERGEQWRDRRKFFRLSPRFSSNSR
jgi:hypothetical protein